MVATSVMSENVEALKKCYRCSFEFSLKDWKVKPNGEFCRMCNDCREDNRAVWHRKSQESKDACRDNHKEKYATDEEYRKKHLEKRRERYATDETYRNKKLERSKISNRVRVKCPDCDKEMNATSLYDHVKNKCCKGKKPEI
jgi:hypothetical protein